MSKKPFFFLLGLGKEQMYPQDTLTSLFYTSIPRQQAHRLCCLRVWWSGHYTETFHTHCAHHLPRVVGLVQHQAQASKLQEHYAGDTTAAFPWGGGEGMILHGPSGS